MASLTEIDLDTPLPRLWLGEYPIKEGDESPERVVFRDHTAGHHDPSDHLGIARVQSIRCALSNPMDLREVRDGLPEKALALLRNRLITTVPLRRMTRAEIAGLSNHGEGPSISLPDLRFAEPQVFMIGSEYELYRALHLGGEDSAMLFTRSMGEIFGMTSTEIDAATVRGA